MKGNKIINGNLYIDIDNERDVVKYTVGGIVDLEKASGGNVDAGKWDTVSPDAPDQPELFMMVGGDKKGGKIEKIEFPAEGEVIIYTEKQSPGCYWYWNRREWIWR